MPAPAGALWLAATFALAGWLVRPAIRRSGLALAHPAVAWLGLEAAFFGLGAAALCLTDGNAGPAWLVGAGVLAFGLGTAGSSAIAGRRGEPDTAPGQGRSGAAGPVPEPGWRGLVPLAAALGALAAVATILARTGIPFLTTDVTSARAELVGLPVQLVRVTLPAVAVGLLFDAAGTGGATHVARDGPRRGRWLVPLAGLLVAFGFTLLLASRYLAAELLATLLLAWLIAGRRLPFRATAAILGLAAVAFIGIGVLRAYGQAQGQELAFAAERTVSRLVLVQPRTLAALEEVIPAEQPYFLGLTWLHRLAPAFGRPDVPNLGYWIYPRVVADAADQATEGYAAPGLVGEAWANFGPAGVALFAMLGAVAERLGALVAVRRTALVDVTAGALAILFLARTHALGLGGLAVLLVLVGSWRLLAGPVGSLAGDLVRVLRYRASSG